MNIVKVNIFRNLKHTLFSNTLSILISFLVVIIIPSIFGLQKYSFWQLYIFYTSYAGILHFGWLDGIYLRFGGKYYNDLNFNVLSSQFYLLVFTQILLSLILYFVACFLIKDEIKLYIFYVFSLSFIVINVRTFLIYILEITNNIIKSSSIIIFDRIIYLIIITFILIFKFTQLEFLVYAEFFSKLISLFYAIIICKQVILSKPIDFKYSILETILNIRVGSKLLIANITGMLIIGIIKVGIETSWNIETFGQISLTLSLSSLLMIFLNAIGSILYPNLKRMEIDELSKFYVDAKNFLFVFSFSVLLFFYPLKFVLIEYLPRFSDSVQFLPLVFPIIVFESKNALLLNVFLKVLRKENGMLIINLFVLFCSFTLTFIFAFWLHNLYLVVLSIVILLSLKSFISELYLTRILNTSLLKDAIIEYNLVIVFIWLSWNLDTYLSILIYLILFFSIILIKRNTLKNTFNNFKKRISN